MRLPARRCLAALVVAAGSIVCAAAPARAELQSVYVLPGSVCNATIAFCEAGTQVYIILPQDYATCSAELTATASGVAEPLQCGWPLYEDGVVGVDVQWNRGGCAQLIQDGGSASARTPLWSYGASSDSSAPATCSTIDESFTMTINFVPCPGTSFQITADVKGNANGTYNSSYNVNATGPCAGAFDVIAVEGP